MEHPFISDLSDKTLEELQQKISDLTSKLNFAYRTGNSALTHQLQMAIESYRNAYQKKINAVFDKQKLNSQIKIQKDK